MTREQLEHAIRAACDASDDNELLIFGSQAILGQFPNAPAALRASVEVDLQPKNHPEATDRVDAMLGEGSQFHATHGFYVHGLKIEAGRFPTGWEDRAVAVAHPQRTRGHTGWCVEAHDLAANKLLAHRDKDRDFVRTLLAERLIDPAVLRERVAGLAIDDETRGTIERWLALTLEDLR